MTLTRCFRVRSQVKRAGEARCLAGIILGRGILGAFLRGIDSGKPDALSRIKHKRVSVRTLRHGG